VPSSKITSFPAFGLQRSWAHARRRNQAEVLRGYAIDNARFCRRVLRHGLGNAKAIYVYNGAGLELLQYARSAGIFGVLEQTIAPYSLVEPLLAEERERWPHWELANVPNVAWQDLAEREQKEWEVADCIVCGSQFVVDGLRAATVDSRAKFKIIPYGVDVQGGKIREYPLKRSLRVLFLGTLELRKGIQYLGAAAKELCNDQVEVRAVGPIRISSTAQAELKPYMELTGPVPRSQLSQQLLWADVFVLPTLAEGSAIVVYEALAAGLPVITTLNAGSVVHSEIDGFIVPIRDYSAIVATLRRIIDDRNLLPHLSSNALSTAKNFTLERYGERLLEIFQPSIYTAEAAL
jgi:glycosyltransferase involved in cell wall biosynthesis